MNWYVVRVQSGREEKIRDSLQRRIKEKGLERHIGRVIVPTERITEIKAGKKSVREKKMYPGYIMIEMELNEKTWYAVRETPGIGDFLGLKEPICVPQHEVDRILAETLASEERPKIKIEFRKGDSVRIKEGPFENFDGTVEEINPTKGLITVAITIFGRLTKVELEYWQVERA
jgi:transcriptional antiterminator NusG